MVNLPKQIVVIKTEHNKVYVGFNGNHLFGYGYYHDGMGGSQMIYDRAIIDIKIDEQLLIKRMKLTFADETQIGYLLQLPKDHAISVMNPFNETVELVKEMVS